MRIALVSPYDLAVPGGVQEHVRHLARELARRGDEVVTVSPGADGPGHRGVGRTVRIPFNDSVAPVALAPTAARRTLAVLRELEPDVVHVHEPVVPWTGLAATLRSPAPVVGTFHAWSDRDRAYRVVAPVARRAAAAVAVRIAVSSAAARYHADALGVPVGSFTVVPNGVEVAAYAGAEPFPELAADGRPHLVFLGRLEPRKGLEQLLHAFVHAKATRPDLRLLVIGDGPERDRCQALLPARLRSDAVFLGRVDEADKRRFLRSGDLLVAPALGGESFGIVLLEAMAAGLPVLASDIPGYRSVVHEGVNGWLSPPGDARALADAITTLIANPAMRKAMAEEGRATADEHDWPLIAARVRTLYERSLHGRDGGRQ